jgi:cell division protein FtsL
LWIAVSGVLLAGVVFVNVAVLRLNLQLDKATHARAQLQAEDATLASQLSSELASPRIQKQAQQDGLVQVDPSTIGYINLGK